MERLIVCETDKGNYAVRPSHWAGIWNAEGKIRERGLNHTAVFHYKEDADWYAKTKNLEEQGKLLRLPCKVGDTVYIPKYYLDCEYDYHCPLGYAEGKNMCENGLVCDHEHKKFFISETLFDISMINSIGKTIFLTPEKAEAALEKMKGEEHE